MMTTDLAKEPVKLLWTGGFDSTFRLLELLIVEGRQVQPIYLIDPQRASTHEELKVQQEILTALDSKFKVRPLPRKVFFKDDYPQDSGLVARWKSIRQRAHFGSQYVWLGSWALATDENGLEMSFVRTDDLVDQGIFIEKEGVRELANSWEAEILAFYSFPLLQRTKAEMRAAALRFGFSDILSLRIFCHNPGRHRRACGSCRPCRIAKQNGDVEGIRFQNKFEIVQRAVFRRLKLI